MTINWIQEFCVQVIVISHPYSNQLDMVSQNDYPMVQRLPVPSKSSGL